MKRNIPPSVFFSAAAAAGLLIAIPACRTTVYGPDHCPVQIQGDGSALVDNKPCRLEDIPKRLESLGMSTSSRIHVSVPDNVQRDTLARISSVLASAGYSQFFFVKPRQSESFAKETGGKPDQKSGSLPPRK